MRSSPTTAGQGLKVKFEMFKMSPGKSQLVKPVGRISSPLTKAAAEMTANRALTEFLKSIV